jgi:hypothetical protein
MKRGLSYIEAIGFYASAWGQRWSKLFKVVSLTCNFLLIGIWTYLPCGVPLLEAYAVSTLKDTNLGSSSSDPWRFFNSCVYHSCKILSKYVRIYNKLCITLNIVTYKLLRLSLIIIVRRQPNVQVMGFNPSTFLLQHRIQCYKQVKMKN